MLIKVNINEFENVSLKWVCYCFNLNWVKRNLLFGLRGDGIIYWLILAQKDNCIWFDKSWWEFLPVIKTLTNVTSFESSMTALSSPRTRESWIEAAKNSAQKLKNGRYLNASVQWEATSDCRRLLLYNALSCNFCDCDIGCWGDIISPLLRWKFVLRPSAKTQGSNERLHDEVVAPRVWLQVQSREK